MHTKIEISLKTIITVAAVILAVFIFTRISDILIQVFVAYVLMTALSPAVSRLQRFRVPKIAAVLLVYLLLLVGIAVVIGGLVPPLVDQTNRLFVQLNIANSPLLNQISHTSFSTQEFSSLLSTYGSSVSQVVTFIISAFAGIFTLFTLMVMSIYMLLGKANLRDYVAWIFRTKDKKERAQLLLERIELSLGSWVRGEVVMMVTIAAMAFLGLRLLNIPYALPLAIFAGLMEALPNIGPTLAAIPAVLVALVSVSPLMALFTAALFAFIQTIENNVIVPQVMRRVVGIRPLMTIVLILLGFRFGGLVGAFLSIPLYIFLRELYSEFDGEIREITQIQ